MKSALQTLQIILKGKVQGVFYRQSAKEKAIELGITGQVMNARDGDVHIIATGTPDQLQKFVAWCSNGPSNAVVKDVITEEMALQIFDSFSIKRF